MYTRKITALGAAILPLFSSVAMASLAIPQTPLNPTSIPQFVDPLPKPAKLDGTTATNVNNALVIPIREVNQQILPKFNAAGNPTGFGPTSVLGYKGQYPGPTIEAERGTRTTGATRRARLLEINELALHLGFSQNQKSTT